MKRAWCTLLALAMLAANESARADCDPRHNASTCLTSDALWPKPGPQRFAYVTSPDLAAPGQFAVGLVTTFQKRPIDLRVAGPSPEGTTTPAIDNQIDSTLLMSFGIIERFTAYAAVPGTVHQSGGGSSAVTGRDEPASTSLRDPRFGVGVALVPRGASGLYAVTGYAELQVPTHSTADFDGEQGAVFSAAVAADLRVASRVTFGAEIGARVRPVTESFFGERQATQALVAIGADVDVLPRKLLSLGLEAQPILGFGARADVHQSAFGISTSDSRAVFGGEWLASVRTELAGSKLSIMAGGGGTLPGGGLIGIGSVRAVLGIAYAPGASAPVPLPKAEPAPLPNAEAPPSATARAAPAIAPAPAPAPPAAEPIDRAPPAPGVEAEPAPLMVHITDAKKQCHAVCTPSPDEGGAVASRIAPYLEELQMCLAKVGAERTRPAALLRFTPEGVLAESQLEAGGYEDMPCVKSARLPAVSGSHETRVRCTLRCQ